MFRQGAGLLAMQTPSNHSCKLLSADRGVSHTMIDELAIAVKLHRVPLPPEV
jgi:hypothetical protein